MNNKIALKLTLYFSAVLLVFALIIGGVFYQFFKQQTIEIKEKEMRLRAEKIAEVLSDNMARMESRHGLHQLTAMRELKMGNDKYELIELD